MVLIPIELFLGFIGFSIALAIFGFIRNPQIPATIVFGGIFILTITVITTSIGIGYSEPEFNEIPNYSLAYPMNVTTGTTNVPFSTTVFGIAERVVNTNSALYNKPISCVIIDLSKTLNPTGTVIVAVLDSSNVVVKQFGSIPTTSIITTQRAYSVCLPNHDYYVLSLYDYVGVKHLNSTATDFVKVHVDTTNPFDGNNSVRSVFGTAWVDTTTNDLRMKLITEKLDIDNIPIEDTSKPNEFEFTNLHKLIFSIFSVTLMLLGGLMVAKD